jgi:hypothetical protein
LAMVIGGLITTTGWGLVLLDASSVAIVVAELIVISFGATMLFAVAPTIIAQASPPDRVSEIAGLLTVIRQLFLGIGAQLVTTLLALDSVVRGGQSFPSPWAYQLTIVAIIGVCVAATALCFALPVARRTPEPHSA